MCIRDSFSHIASRFFSSEQVFVVVFSSAYLIRKYSSTNVSGSKAQKASMATLRPHGSSRVADDSTSSVTGFHGYEGSRGEAASRARNSNYNEHTAATGGDLGRTGERVSEATRGRMQYKAMKFRTVSRTCLLYTSPSPRDATLSRMPSSA